MKVEQVIVEKLVEMGGKVWEKGDMHRVYFDAERLVAAVPEADRVQDGCGKYGFEVDFRNGIGQNAYGRRVRAGKYYVDMETGELSVRCVEESASVAMGRMLAKVFEMAKDAARDDAKDAEPAAEQPAERAGVHVSPVATTVEVDGVGTVEMRRDSVTVPSLETVTVGRDGYCHINGTEVSFKMGCLDRRSEEIEFDGWVGADVRSSRPEYFDGDACDFSPWMEQHLPELSCGQREALDRLAYRLIG